MSTKAEECEWIAMHLYDESRVDQVLASRHRRADPPMWHELERDEQLRWVRKAARLQDWLSLCRSNARRRAS